MNIGKGFIVLALLIICIGSGTTQAVAAVDTTGNNFTMLDSGGGFIGGTNDVHFTWDGTAKTSVDSSGQVYNATISSSCGFFGHTWAAHDVAIYGPGTYTVYDDCAAGSPGCGSGNPVTFTVAAGQLGGHMLFYWNGSDNIDVVDIWQAGAFAPSSLWTGACGSNAGSKVWDWMSTDWNGDGINGAPMTDGPFSDSNANFNLMGTICSCPVCDDGNACNGLELCDQINGCVCVAGTPKDCNDGDACTSDSCDAVGGNCVNTPIPDCNPCSGMPNGTVCDDVNPCTTGDMCSNNACVGTPKNCDDGNQCTADSCIVSTGACSNLNAPMNGKPCDDGDGNACTGACSAGVCTVGAVVNCDDSKACTTDMCDSTAGCIHTPTLVCFSSHGNNFTMLTAGGGYVGGTNDVVFTWDGTCNTSVATAVVNATINSDEPFFGTTWASHDVMIYCPGGPYTIYAGCAAGDADCGSGPNYTFTVGPNQLAGHMLFYWNGSDNIDLVNIWEEGTFVGKQSYFINPYPDNGYYCQTPTCDGSSNSFTKVWDMVSTDWEGNGISGRGFIDGPFIGFNGNFNLMNTIVDKCAGIVCTPFDYDHVTQNVCQTGACDPATGQCVFTAANEGGACSDFQDCTAGDTCVSGVCVSGPAKADGATCDCGYGLCYSGAVCAGGVCSCGTQKFCPTIDNCTYNVCDKATGECVASAKCNDTDPGTTDTCNATTGACTYTAIGGYAAQIMVAESIAPTDDLNMPFGDVAIRSASTQTVTVINSGNANLKISGITVSPAPFYNVVGKDLCSNKSIAPGGTCTISVRFKPLSIGAFTGSLIIPSNVVSTPTVTVTLSGNSVCDPASCDDGNACTDDSQDANCNCIHTAKYCDDGNLCTNDSCDPANGACIHADKTASCDDGTACTTDSCNQATGNCVYTPTPRCIDTSNNNFTMIAAAGDLIGGTNDVRFTWDGTMKTSVAVSGQLPNATISSPCSFFNNTWFAHDVAIYGPGTHTVYVGCAPGSPGCGSGTPITFTVNAGEIGGHMLFNWSTNTDIDVVDIWTPNAAFDGKICVKEAYPIAPGLGMCGLALPCGDNPANKVWDLMSRDVNGDGVNGNPMVDGPFLGFNANFNLMACGDCNDYNNCTTDTCDAGVCNHVINSTLCPTTSDNNFTMLDPDNNIAGGTNDVTFAWDGTMKTAVAVSGQVSNAILSSPCPFFGPTWAAHDVTVYGTGSYCIDTDCPAGSPGCGLGAQLCFAVGANEIGVHMLFDWNGNNNINVVNVMKLITVSSTLWTGGCGSNSACTLWILASYDFDGDGVNGMGMVDGPFVGMNANFNLGKVTVYQCCDAATRCDDGDACTIDTCDPASGFCSNTPRVCGDGNACNGGETCDPTTGNCVNGTPVDCNDNDACTNDICNTATGLCSHTPKDCNDNNLCTMDTCDPAVGCINYPLPSDDGNPCTIDTCDPLTGMHHDLIDCSDGKACTIDSCNTATGLCQNVDTICDDGLYCNGMEMCSPLTGLCMAGTPVNCNDGNACTTDSCNETTDSCDHRTIVCVPMDKCHTAACDPANGCVQTPIVCDDGDACTIDTCNAATGCVYTPKVCDDGNVCTTDACVNGSCVYTPVDDGTVCTVNGEAGTCQSGTCAPIDVCPKHSRKSVRLVGSGQAWWIERQIQTEFTVQDKSGCILAHTNTSVTASPGAILKVNWKVGTAPLPTTVTWKPNGGTTQTLNAKKLWTLTCPATTGTVGTLTLNNTKGKGKDSDTLTVKTSLF